jgi:hypothetical protein
MRGLHGAHSLPLNLPGGQALMAYIIVDTRFLTDDVSDHAVS